MNSLLFFALPLLFYGTILSAQDADSLDCAKKKRLILESQEVKEWQEVLFHYQKSRILRFSSAKKVIIPQDALDMYDYEWKTRRWQHYQHHGEGIEISSDTLQEALNTKGKALKSKFDLLKTMACKQSLFEEINSPVFDSLKVIRHQFYMERTN